MSATIVTKISKLPLLWSEALRAVICMVPMLLTLPTNKTSYIVALGQGGFFYSSIFLPKRFGGRLIMGGLVVTLGLGFYLIGGNVAAHPGTALIFTFFVSLMLGFLSSWKLGGPLALTFIMIYTAGLNTGSASKASANFLVFAGVLGWSALISLLPFWKGIDPPVRKSELTDLDYAEQGLRMGVGTSLALGISYLFSFSKLGWAPSAVGNIVRYDEKVSRLRAWARFYGTVGGALLALVALDLTHNINLLIYAGVLFAALNGLFKLTKVGMIPLFYTATILLLYSLNDLPSSRTVAFERVAYNIIGITIGMLVVIYPFPHLMKALNKSAIKTPQS